MKHSVVREESICASEAADDSKGDGIRLKNISSKPLKPRAYIAA